MDKVYDFINRFAALITGLADNAAFVALLATYPNIKPQHLIYLHLIAMVAKSIYYKGNKVVPHEEEEMLKITGGKPSTTLVLANLHQKDCFNYNGQLYIKCQDQVSDATTKVLTGKVWCANLNMGTVVLLPTDTVVELRETELKVK
jgi:hypothetical protein